MKVMIEMYTISGDYPYNHNKHLKYDNEFVQLYLEENDISISEFNCINNTLCTHL